MSDWAQIELLARHLGVAIERCPKFGRADDGEYHECGFPHECIGGFVLIKKDGEGDECQAKTD